MPPSQDDRRGLSPQSGSLEELNCLFVLLRGSARLECAEIFPLAGFVLFLRVQSVLSGFEFPDHALLQERMSGDH